MNPAIILAVIAALTLLYTGILAASVFSKPPSKLAARGRLDIVAQAADAVLLMILIHALAPWTTVPVALWFVPVAIIAASAVGAVLRWGSLPTVRAGRSPRRSWIYAGMHVGVTVLVALVALWP